MKDQVQHACIFYQGEFSFSKSEETSFWKTKSGQLRFPIELTPHRTFEKKHFGPLTNFQIGKAKNVFC